MSSIFYEETNKIYNLLNRKSFTLYKIYSILGSVRKQHNKNGKGETDMNEIEKAEHKLAQWNSVLNQAMIVGDRKSIEDAKAEIENYKETIVSLTAEKEQEKTSTEVIDVFLNVWKEKAMDYYLELREEYFVQSEMIHEINADNLSKV